MCEPPGKLHLKSTLDCDIKQVYSTEGIIPAHTIR